MDDSATSAATKRGQAPARQSAIGVEIGGTKLQACLGDTGGNIGHTLRSRVPEGADAHAILGWFETAIPELLAYADSNGLPKPKVIGVGFGGPVDSTRGLVLASHQVSGWSGFPLAAWFEERFALPTRVENDSNAAGWAEYKLGAGRGTRSFVYMNIGSGIGGALVIDGKLHNGQGRGAGEIGHTYIADWTSSITGAIDKVENLCSGWAIERRLRAMLHPPAATCSALGEAARQGNSEAKAEIDNVANALGAVLANLIALLHPERIAIGGGVALLGEVLLAPLRNAVAARVFGPFKDRYELVPCALEESVVLAGALLLADQSHTA